MNNQGFTLIEVMLYITLFSFLIGSVFVAAYQLIDGSGKLNTKNIVQTEGNFVMRKFAHSLMNIDPAIATIPSSGTTNMLQVTKYDGNQIDICLDANKIKIREGGGAGLCNTFLPLTTDNVSVNSLQFTYITPIGSAPPGITAVAIINGMNFTITKYFRK